MEAPKGLLGQVAFSVFLGSTRVGCISRKLPEEVDGAGAGDEGEEGGPGPPDM